MFFRNSQKTVKIVWTADGVIQIFKCTSKYHLAILIKIVGRFEKFQNNRKIFVAYRRYAPISSFFYKSQTDDM